MTKVQFSINDGGSNIPSGVASSASLTESNDQFARNAQNAKDTTPLPKSALAGTALLGVMGLSQLKRQRLRGDPTPHAEENRVTVLLSAKR